MNNKVLEYNHSIKVVIYILSIRQKVLLACEANEMTLTELAGKLGTSQANLSKRIKTGKFTQDELHRITDILNCKYDSSWTLPDGTRLD